MEKYIRGTWKLNAQINYWPRYEDDSDGKTYYADLIYPNVGIVDNHLETRIDISLDYDAIRLMDLIIKYSYEVVYEYSIDGVYWSAEKYRTIDFGPNGALVDSTSYEWFINNATLISPPDYTKYMSVAGQWRFLNSMTVSDKDSFTEIIRKVPQADSEPMTAIYTEDGSLKMSPGISGYLNPGDIIDFGTSSQYISKDFYDWLIKNAAPIRRVGPSVVGKYKIASSLRIVPSSTLIADVRFASNGKLFDGMNVYPFGDVSYMHIFNSSIESDYNNNPELLFDHNKFNSKLQFVDFGPTEQFVSQDFYDWFIGMSDKIEDTDYIIDGVWKLSDVPFLPDTMSQTSYFYCIMSSFCSNGAIYDCIRIEKYVDHITWDSSTLNDIFMYYGDEMVYQQSVGWSNEEFKRVDFGTNNMTLSEADYESFMKVAEKDTVYTITESTLTDIADAIRAKTGLTSRIPTSAFAQLISEFTNVAIHEGVLAIVEGSANGSTNVSVKNGNLIIK